MCIGPKTRLLIGKALVIMGLKTPNFQKKGGKSQNKTPNKTKTKKQTNLTEEINALVTIRVEG